MACSRSESFLQKILSRIAGKWKREGEPGSRFLRSLLTFARNLPRNSRASTPNGVPAESSGPSLAPSPPLRLGNGRCVSEVATPQAMSLPGLHPQTLPRTLRHLFASP